MSGFSQGLNFVVGLLLCVVEEDIAFWLLSSLVEDICPNYHSSNMGGLKIDLLVRVVLFVHDTGLPSCFF